MAIANNIKRFSLLLVMLVAFIVIALAAAQHAVTYHSFVQHLHYVKTWVHTHYSSVVIYYLLAYVICIASSLPVGVYLSLAGGFLFGPLWGSVYAIFAASCGACFPFLAVRKAVGNSLSRRARGWVKHLDLDVHKHPVNYVLFLHIFAFIPFVAANLIAGLFDIRLRTFFFTTIIGAAPATIALAFIGNDGSKIFANGRHAAGSQLMQSGLLWPLLALAFLILVPLIYRYCRSNTKNN